MAFIDNILTFITTQTPYQLLRLFWYFIIFDFTRYIVTDIIFLFYITCSDRKKEARDNALKRLYKEGPLITILAPGKNEGKHIEKLAASLNEQTYKNLEIIIIDDGSDDETPHIGRKLLKEGKIDKFLRNEIRGGKASAANLGLRFCKGKYIVHLDADSHLRRDSIEKIVAPFYMDPKIGAVAGDLRVANMFESFATVLQGMEYMKSLSLSRIINSKLGILRIVSGAFGAFRRDLLKRLGGWDVGPGLDGDITMKIRKLHYKVHFEPAAVCYTNVPNTLWKLAKQRFRWDRSLVRFRLRKHFDVLLPSKEFNIYNFLSSVENILFNFVFNFKWWIYTIYLIVFNMSLLKYIVPINYLLYTITNLIEYAIACIVLNKTLKLREQLLFPFIPLMPLYNGIFLRIVRTYAYLMELLFKVSYEDKWNPWKVSKKAKDKHL